MLRSMGGRGFRTEPAPGMTPQVFLNQLLLMAFKSLAVGIVTILISVVAGVVFGTLAGTAVSFYHISRAFFWP